MNKTVCAIPGYVCDSETHFTMALCFLCDLSYMTCHIVKTRRKWQEHERTILKCWHGLQNWSRLHPTSPLVLRVTSSAWITGQGFHGHCTSTGQDPVPARLLVLLVTGLGWCGPRNHSWVCNASHYTPQPLWYHACVTSSRALATRNILSAVEGR